MAGMEFRISAVDNASQTFKGIADNIQNMQRIANSSGGQAVGSAGIIADSASSQGIHAIKANGNSLPISTQNMTEKLALISDNLNKIATMLPQLIEKSGKGSSGVNASSASNNIAKLQSNLARGVTAVTLGSALVTGEKRYQTGLKRASLRGETGDVFGEESARLDADLARKQTWTSAIPMVFGVGGALLTKSPLGFVAGQTLGQGVKQLVDDAMGADTDDKKVNIEKMKQRAEIYGGYASSIDALRVNSGNRDLGPIESKEYNIHTLMRLRDARKGTGMGSQEFLSLLSDMSLYGLGNNEARAAALIGKNTNTNPSQIGNFMSLNARFGNKDVIGSTNFAFSAASASGMKDGQFGEFLTGLQGVIEDGIANGFVASSEEVSKTMVMFSKLSNENPLWQGKYGFEKLNSINKGIASATSLSNSSQMLAYQAYAGLVKDGVRGGAYINGADGLNTLSLMEGGLQTEGQFEALKKVIMNRYGNDPEAAVMAIKQISGLNYTGSMQMYQMMNGTSEYSDVKLKEINTEFKSDSARQLDELENIKLNTAVLGTADFKGLTTRLNSKAYNLNNDISQMQEHSIVADAGIAHLLGFFPGDKGAEGNAYRNWMLDLNAEYKGRGVVSNGYKEAIKDGYIDQVEVYEYLKKIVDTLNRYEEAKKNGTYKVVTEASSRKR